MGELYKILGVARDVGDAELKKAYRNLAKKLHPDRNPEDKGVAEHFKKVSAAYAILGDEKQRQRYDRGEIDAQGHETMAGFRPGGGRPGGAHFDFGNMGGFSADDLFGGLFGAMRGAQSRPRRRSAARKGADLRYRLSVSFVEAAVGCTKRLKMVHGKTLNVKFPAGVTDGQQIRLKGQGGPGEAGGQPGDALVEVGIEAHDYFTRDGRHIRLDLPITLQESVQGARIAVPTIHGAVNLTIPKGTNSGQVLRLRGKGIAVADGRGKPAAPGDQYVRLMVVLPSGDEELESFVREWGDGHVYEVRERFAGGAKDKAKANAKAKEES